MRVIMMEQVIYKFKYNLLWTGMSLGEDDQYGRLATNSGATARWAAWMSDLHFVSLY